MSLNFVSNCFARLAKSEIRDEDIYLWDSPKANLAPKFLSQSLAKTKLLVPKASPDFRENVKRDFRVNPMLLRKDDVTGELLLLSKLCRPKHLYNEHVSKCCSHSFESLNNIESLTTLSCCFSLYINTQQCYYCHTVMCLRRKENCFNRQLLNPEDYANA